MSRNQAAREARDEAIGRVSRNLTDEEKLAALVLVGEIAECRATFTTDDVPFDFPLGVDSRASGYVMMAAAREGFIEATDQWRESDQAACHARPKRVWRSLISP